MGRRAVVLVVALVLAGASAFAIFQYLNNVRDEVNEGAELIPVFRATALIQEGTLGDEVLRGGPGVTYTSSEEQRVDLPQGAIQTPEDLEAVLSGKVAVGPIPQNGIIVASQWVSPSVELTPLKDSISAGKQALTISPGDVQGVNGFAQPGDLVNVIVTIDLEVGLTAGAQAPNFGVPSATGGEGEDAELSVVVPYTRFVLQNLRVLAAGQEVVPPDSASQSVNVDGEVGTGDAAGTVQDGGEDAPALSTIYTLEVDPNQAERLVYAIQNGSVYLTLVPDDNQPIATRGVTVETLFEGDLIDDIFQN